MEQRVWVQLLNPVWLCNLMDCSPPGSSVLGISQARVLEWVAISFSRVSSRPRDQTYIFCTGRQILYHCATSGKPWNKGWTYFFLINQFIYFTTTLYWFCHTLTWLHHGCTCVPHPEPPSHLPPHPIPLGRIF